MLAIENGVIKNVDELCPKSQNYLKKLTEGLQLTNKPNQFNIGFLYAYAKDGNEKWNDAKGNFKKDKIKELFPSIGKKFLKTEDRQQKPISEIVALIQNDILTKIKNKEGEYLTSHQTAFDRRRSLANFIKKLTIGIFGSTFFALATTALIIKGYISLPVIMPIIMPVVALVIANPIIASAALITAMTMLFLASWKAISSKRNAGYALARVETQTQGNIHSLDSAMEQPITPMKNSSAPPQLQSNATPTVLQIGAKPSREEDVVEQTANPPSYSPRA